MDSVRDGYDRLARAYAENLWEELEGKPLDRWLLDRVAAESHGTIVDVGCGPGHVSAYLRDRGAAVVGVDLSPGMVDEARRLVPDVEFEVGDMRSLTFEDGELGAVVAMYSLIHVDRDQLRSTVMELARVLKPGGLLLAAVHAGTETVHPDELFGVEIDIDFNYIEPDELFAAVGEAGLAPREQLVRWPYEGAEHSSRRAYVLAVK